MSEPVSKKNILRGWLSIDILKCDTCWYYLAFVAFMFAIISYIEANTGYVAIGQFNVSEFLSQFAFQAYVWGFLLIPVSNRFFQNCLKKKSLAAFCDFFIRIWVVILFIGFAFPANWLNNIFYNSYLLAFLILVFVFGRPFINLYKSKNSDFDYSVSSLVVIPLIVSLVFVFPIVCGGIDAFKILGDDVLCLLEDESCDPVLMLPTEDKLIRAFKDLKAHTPVKSRLKKYLPDTKIFRGFYSMGFNIIGTLKSRIVKRENIGEKFLFPYFPKVYGPIPTVAILNSIGAVDRLQQFSKVLWLNWTKDGYISGKEMDLILSGANSELRSFVLIANASHMIQTQGFRSYFPVSETENFNSKHILYTIKAYQEIGEEQIAEAFIAGWDFFQQNVTRLKKDMDKYEIEEFHKKLEALCQKVAGKKADFFQESKRLEILQKNCSNVLNDLRKAYVKNRIEL